MNDPQRELVYAMERLEFGGHWTHTVKLHTARRWVRQCCKILETPLPKLVVKNVRGHRAEYDHETQTIVLDPKFGRSGVILLHELAHHVTYAKHPFAQDHGPAFVLAYATLLHMARLVPIAGTLAACRKHGVKIARRL